MYIYIYIYLIFWEQLHRGTTRKNTAFPLLLFPNYINIYIIYIHIYIYIYIYIYI